MIMSVPLISIAVWLLVGSACGWLESERVPTGAQMRVANMVIGVVGAVAAGMFFLSWGELVPRSPLLGPLASGLVGAGISLSVSGTAARLLARR